MMGSTLKSLFLRLHESGSPTLLDLVQLRSLLDHECLRHWDTSALSPRLVDYAPDLIKRIAIYLSGPISQVEDLESSAYRIQQLRALVAALALLHHLNVQELHDDPYNRLRLNITDRFNDIAHGRRRSRSTLTQKHRHIESLYLIRLVAQYFSLFRRSSGPEALAVPVLGLILTGASVVS